MLHQWNFGRQTVKRDGCSDIRQCLIYSAPQGVSPQITKQAPHSSAENKNYSQASKLPAWRDTTTRRLTYSRIHTPTHTQTHTQTMSRLSQTCLWYCIWCSLWHRLSCNILQLPLQENYNNFKTHNSCMQIQCCSFLSNITLWFYNTWRLEILSQWSMFIYVQSNIHSFPQHKEHCQTGIHSGMDVLL